ncbi:MAG: hypothetical protein HOB73_16640 [Planctomycetaceae bacterium]|jgi:hypothetical protein|nr:hypothetical protein [Planctomycetaceae bacterium]
MDLKTKFEMWRDVFKIQVDFIRELGQYRLNVAKSSLVAAVASNQLAVARMKAQVAQELEGALRRLHQIEGRLQTKAQRVTTMAKDVSFIHNGADMTKSRMEMMWAAFRVFERLVPLQQIQASMEIEVQPSARLAHQFIDKYDTSQECESVPVSVDNAYMLVGWLKKMHYLPARGSKAYLLVMKVFETLAEVAQQQIDALNQARRQIRENTFDVWNPLIIAGLPDTLDVKKILSAGIKSL